MNAKKVNIYLQAITNEGTENFINKGIEELWSVQKLAVEELICIYFYFFVLLLFFYRFLKKNIIQLNGLEKVFN